MGLDFISPNYQLYTTGPICICGKGYSYHPECFERQEREERQKEMAMTRFYIQFTVDGGGGFMECHKVIEAATWSQAHGKAVEADEFGKPSACFPLSSEMAIWPDRHVLDYYERHTFHAQWKTPQVQIYDSVEVDAVFGQVNELQAHLEKTLKDIDEQIEVIDKRVFVSGLPAMAPVRAAASRGELDAYEDGPSLSETVTAIKKAVHGRDQENWAIATGVLVTALIVWSVLVGAEVPVRWPAIWIGTLSFCVSVCMVKYLYMKRFQAVPVKTGGTVTPVERDVQIYMVTSKPFDIVTWVTDDADEARVWADTVEGGKVLGEKFWKQGK